MFSLKESREASQDLRDIWLDLEEKSYGLGDKFIDEYEAIAPLLRSMPTAYGHPVRQGSQVKRTNLKRFIYAVFYIINEEEGVVTILRVLPQKIRPDKFPR